MKLLIIIIAILNVAYIYSQDYTQEEKLKVDSLIRLIESNLTHDTVVVNAYLGLAYVYYIKEPLKAIDACREAEKVSERIGFTHGKGESYAFLGYLIHNQGDIPGALGYFVKSLGIRKEIGNKDDIANSYNNIGYIYEGQGDLKQAKYYFFKALELRQEIGNKKTIANSKNNLGMFFIKNKNPSKGITYIIEAFELRQEIKDSSGLALSNSALGEYYSKKGVYETSLKYFGAARDINERLKNYNELSKNYNSLGTVSKSNGNDEEALTYLNKCLELSIKIGYVELIMASSSELYKIYKMNKKPQEALEAYELFVQMSDSLNNEKTLTATIKLKAKQKYDKKMLADSIIQQEALKIKNTEIALSKAEADKGKLKIAQQNKQKWYLYIGLGLVALFAVFMYNRFRVTNKQKYIITKQKELADNQKTEIQKQHLLLEETHQEIKDSINYAKRLQTAILPAFEDVNEYLPDSFVFFKPKDVVSGDFYWFEHVDGVSYIAAADCTGHGVPGALVSVVCSNALNRSVKEFGIKNPAEILDKTRSLVIETFAKSGENVKDGMDIVFCAIDGLKVTYSGAGNPLWIVKDVKNATDEQIQNPKNVIIESKILVDIKGDKQPIGLYEGMLPFSQIEVELTKGDLIFLFTDGFADQFGGEKGKKFKYKPFKKLLLSNCNLSMEDQQNELANHFENWKGSQEQVDDVCVIGIKL